MKKAVVTGATSFIGVHLVQQLLHRGFTVYAVIRPDSANEYRLTPQSGLRVLPLNLTDIDRLPKQIGDTADVFFHLSWDGARAPYRDNRELQHSNYLAALQAADCARAFGCSTFVGAGSQAEYGACNHPIDESEPCNPSTEYGKAKLLSYQNIVDRFAHDMRIVWPRIFSVYGPYDFAGTLMSSAIRQMMKNKILDLTPCTQYWDFLYVEDAARALLSLYQTPTAQGVFHIADGHHRPLMEYLMDMKDILHSQSQLNFGAVDYGSGGPMNLRPIADKIRAETDWQPIIKFPDGIRKTKRAMEQYEKD